jgi:hypothetical protein
MTMRHAAGGAGDLDEPKRTPDEGVDAEGRLDADDGPDGGVAAAIKGTSLAGPTGGTVVAVTDGSLGSTVDPDPDRTAHEEPEER